MKAVDSTKTYLNLCTRYYEIDRPKAPQEAYDFYSRCVKAAEKPVLEPMCGSGRFLLPLLEEGYEVHGFDASSYMLGELKKKCLHKFQPKVWRQHFEELDLKQRYGLIIIPGGSFALISDLETVIKCLKKVYDHLADDGKFVFDIENKQSTDHLKLKTWKGNLKKIDQETYIILSTLALAEEDHLATFVFRYELVKNGLVEKVESEIFNVRYYELSFMDDLLREIGFSFVHRFKPFDPRQSVEKCDEVVVYECTK